MRLGLIARADNVGLGTQTWEFYRHMRPDKTAVIDISAASGAPTYSHRYPDKSKTFTMAQWQQSQSIVDEFLHDLDVVFTCETAYRDNFYTLAFHKNVKTVLQANFEFMPWATDPALPMPDVFWMSSEYNLARAQNIVSTARDVQGWQPKVSYVLTPVDRDRCAPRIHEQCRRFIHVTGRKTDFDRNGTISTVQAMRRANVGSMFTYTQPLSVRHQPEQFTPGDGSTVVPEMEHYWTLYGLGDVFVAPRRYAGQSLTMQEALACGLPVIATDVDPNNRLLPPEWLVPARKTSVQFVTQSGNLDVYDADVEILAQKLLEMQTSRNFVEMSLHALDLAEPLSWQHWEGPYREALQRVVSMS